MGLLADYESLLEIIVRESSRTELNFVFFEEMANQCEFNIENIKRNGETNTKTVSDALKISLNLVRVLEKFNNEIDAIVGNGSKTDESTAINERRNDLEQSKNVESMSPCLFPIRADLSIYQSDSAGFCEITHVEDIENQICYIVDIERSSLPEMKLFATRSVLEFQPIDLNQNKLQVFGIEINGHNYRAAWTFENQYRTQSNQICLIDTGKILNIDTLRNNRMFLLPENIKLIPAYAIRSKIVKRGALDLADSMKHKVFNFKVVNVAQERQMLDVELSTNPFDLFDKQDQAISISTKKNEEFGNLQNHALFNFKQSSNNNCEDRGYFKMQNVLKTGNSMSLNKASRTVFSHKPPSDELYSLSKPLSQARLEKSGRKLLSNVLSSQSDQSPLFQPNVLAKPEQSVVRASTSSELGHPTVNTIYRICIQMPEVGEMITIIATSILSVEHIFAQFTIHKNSFEQFQLKLNCNTNLSRYRRYSGIPDNSELILVTLYDGLMHRAKVVNNLDANKIQIMCLDTGIVRFVCASECYYWEPFCSDCPFQAVKCNLINVKMIKNDHREAVSYFQDLILNKFVRAEIINVCKDEIYVKLIDDAGFDIGEQLCVVGMAKLRSH